MRRDNQEKIKVSLSEIEETIGNILEEIHSNLYQKALDRLQKNTVKVDNWEEFKDKIEKRYFILAHWNGDSHVEKKIKEETGATIRCVPFDQVGELGKCIYTGEESNKRVLFAKAY